MVVLIYGLGRCNRKVGRVTLDAEHKNDETILLQNRI